MQFLVRHQAVISILDKHHLHCFSRITIVSLFPSLCSEIPNIHFELFKHHFRVIKASAKVLIFTPLLPYLFFAPAACISLCWPHNLGHQIPVQSLTSRLCLQEAFSIITFLNRCDLSSPALQSKLLSSLSLHIS